MISSFTFKVILALMAALMALSALRIGAPELVGADAVSADYMIFHQVGELANQGRAALPYDAAAFKAHQAARTGSDVFMTWTYPPQFNLLIQPLALLPVWVGYLVFTGLSFAGFIWAMLLLGPDAARFAILLCLPALVINLLTGQNGFLTAGLMALFARQALAGRLWQSGITLGLLAYKPHLGLGLGLVALLRGGARMVLTACATLAACLALVTVLYGADIWAALAQGIETSRLALEAGQYKLVRMSTPFALLRSLGLSAPLALNLHVITALSALAALTFAALRNWPLSQVIALGMITGAALSPYAYDYDLCLLAPALALLWPVLSTRLKPWERATFACATLLATGFGLCTVIFSEALKGLPFPLPALGGAGYLALLLLTLTALIRANRA